MPSYLRYAFYLACSWLWCLGGFFPLILSRDYGWPVLAVFTMFNVVGAAAMGFYFNRERQRDFALRHRAAISVFSYVTIIYQLFFVAWLGFVIGQPLLLAAVFTLALIIHSSKSAITTWAIGFYIASILLLTYFSRLEWSWVDVSLKPYWPHALLPLAIGFIFSPYLDITFHRAYRDSDKPRVSFALGFGLLFLSLLFCVFCYAGSLSEVFFRQALPSTLIYPVIGFLVLQTAFTIAAHTSELSLSGIVTAKRLWPLLAGIFVVLWGFVKLWGDTSIPVFDVPVAETVYKSFLFFYGLAFPLYLLLSQSRRLYVFTLAVCTPAYSVGFLIGGEYSYMLTAAIVIMAVALVFKRRVSVQSSGEKSV